MESTSTQESVGTVQETAVVAQVGNISLPQTANNRLQDGSAMLAVPSATDNKPGEATPDPELVVAAIGGAPVRMAFTPFTKESHQKLIKRELELKVRINKQKHNDEGRLVNGEIVFEEDDDDFLKIDANPKLADTQPLPDKYGRFPKDLYGKPIEELDHYIKYKSFVVISKSGGRNKISRYSATNSVFLFAPWNPARKVALAIINNQYFDFAILLTIVVNCALLAVDPASYAVAASQLEYTFLGIYTAEFFLKMVGRGFILNKHTYLRDGWSYIDFTVILTSYLTVILTNLNAGGSGFSFIKVLRAFRVLRALKGISIVPGLRTIVNSLLNSMRMLGEVILLAFFVVMIFALLAMQIYAGVFQQKCVNMGSFTSSINESLLDIAYYEYVNNASNWVGSGWQDDSDYVLCGNESNAFNCSAVYNQTVCLQVGQSPNWNYTHFDDMGYAMLNVFQIFTMDHWEDVYNKSFKLKGPWSILYFLILIFFGSFYVINLILAVVRNAYATEAHEEARIKAEEDEEEAARAKRNENTALLFDPKKLRERLSRQPSLDDRALASSTILNESTDPGKSAVPLPEIVINNGSIAESVDEHEPNSLHLKVEKSMNRSTNNLTANSEFDKQSVRTSHSHTDGTEDVDLEMVAEDISALAPRHRRYLLQKFANLWLNKIKSEDNQLIDRNCACCAKSGCLQYHSWVKFQNIVFKVATDGLFELFITLSIVVNTLMMSTEHFGMSEEHKKANEIANQVFTWVFTLEAILKITALSKEYFKIGWNIFDLIIVIFSLLDFVLSNVTIPLEQAKSVRVVTKVVKIFRLMRIVKLAQSWSTMKKLLEIIIGSLGALLNVTIVLFVVIFLFAVLGNQLFGPNYSLYYLPPTDMANASTAEYANVTGIIDYLGVIPRWNFTDFFHSFLVVFHILCSSWIEMCWDCMNVNNDVGCIILFIATLIVGNFMVLNLFLALLLDAFDGDNIKKQESVRVEEGKLKKSLLRIVHCFKKSNMSSKMSITPASSVMGHHLSTPGSKMTMQGHSLTPYGSFVHANGSHVSVKSAISHITMDLPHPVLAKSHESLKSSGHMNNILNSTELKPLGFTSDLCKDNSSAVFPSVLGSCGGILHRTDPEISAMNLQNIEQAFHTHRDQYARFENAVIASQLGTSPQPRGPVIIAEDFSDSLDVRKTIFLHGGSALLADENLHDGSSSDEDAQEAVEPEVVLVDIKEERAARMKEIEEKAKSAEEGEVQYSATGDIILPDCCCAVCYSKFSCCNTACTSRWAKDRLMCSKIVTNKIFEGFILVLIILSSLSLCFEDVYLYQREVLQEALEKLGWTFTAIFVMEMILKWFGLGFKRYFSSFWTILDCAIVFISLADIIMGQIPGVTSITAFKALRTLRALRPLRAVSRWEGMKVVLNALIFALPAIGKVLMVCLVFWLIFAILGVQTFAGMFYACYDWDPTYQPLVAIFNNKSYGSVVRFYSNVTDMESCLMQNYTWRNRPVNFDNVFNAYLALYQMATYEGWMEIMRSATDMATTMGDQPTYENSMLWYLYFIFFIIVGSFFTLNLFIGVIIDNFNSLKRQYDGSYLSSLLTESQRHYYNTLKKLGSKKPQKTIRRPKNKFLIFFFDLASNRKFDYIIMIVILLNMVVLSLDRPNETADMKVTLKILNNIFTAIFLIEAIVKLFGYRAHYFRRAWNVFDFIIVAISSTGEVLEYTGGSLLAISPTTLRIIRVFRIGRVLRLIKAAKGIRKLLYTLISALPGLFNIACLLFIFMFVFSIMGMSLYCNVKYNQVPITGLTEHVNFMTFGSTLSILFRIMTVAGWNDILNGLMVQPPYCNQTHYEQPDGTWVASANGQCGDMLGAPIFMVLYLLLTSGIIVNMYIAVILESYDDANEQEEVGIVEDDIDMFYNYWEMYDPLATQYIAVSKLSDFLAAIEEPLAITKPNSMAIVAFNLPIVEGEKVHCLDLLMGLVKRVIHTMEDSEPNMSDEQKDANDKLKKQIAAKYKATFPQRLSATVISTTMQRKKEDVAAKTLQRAWRRHKMQKNIMNIKERALEQTQKEAAAEEEAAGVTQLSKLSNSIGIVATRVGSIIRRVSRNDSMRSVRSIDSASLHTIDAASPAARRN